MHPPPMTVYQIAQITTKSTFAQTNAFNAARTAMAALLLFLIPASLVSQASFSIKVLVFQTVQSPYSVICLKVTHAKETAFDIQLQFQ